MSCKHQVLAKEKIPPGHLSNRVLAVISRRYLGRSLTLRGGSAGFWSDGSQQAPGLGLYPILGGSQLVFSLPAVSAHLLLSSAWVRSPDFPFSRELSLGVFLPATP